MIKSGKAVSLAYTLKDAHGNVVDSSDASDPFLYLHGAGQIVPGLERALENLKTGDRKRVTVQPSEGYGEIDKSLQMVVNRSQFPKSAKLEPGTQFETNTPDGHNIIFCVTQVQGDQVSIDANHPMAGKVLEFEVEVLDVREATAEELEHGHAHGAHAHSHEGCGGCDEDDCCGDGKAKGGCGSGGCCS